MGFVGPMGPINVAHAWGDKRNIIKYLVGKVLKIKVRIKIILSIANSLWLELGKSFFELRSSKYNKSCSHFGPNLAMKRAREVHPPNSHLAKLMAIARGEHPPDEDDVSPPGYDSSDDGDPPPPGPDAPAPAAGDPPPGPREQEPPDLEPGKLPQQQLLEMKVPLGRWNPFSPPPKN